MNRETPPIWHSFIVTTAGTVALFPAFMLWCSRLAATRAHEWDTTITRWCSGRSPRMAWRLFSRMGDGWLYAVTFLWLRYMDERALANHMAECVFLAWGIGSALKLLIRRKRQNPIHRRVRMLTTFSSWSFPSQHAAVVVAFAFAMWPNPGALALAIVVCCSRVLSGAHYAGDVLAGIAVGLLAGRVA